MLYFVAAVFWGVASGNPYRPPQWVYSGLPRSAGVAIVWLLLICELQLTQFIGFLFYVAFFWIWLPFHLAGARSQRRKAAAGQTNRSTKLSTSLRLWHVAGLALLLAVVVFWPLPSRLFAGIAALVGLIPAALLIKRAWVVAMSPADWVVGLKGRAADAYQRWKAESERVEARGNVLAASATVLRAPAKVVRFLEKPINYRVVLRTSAIFYFFGLIAILLLYLGFEAALWLRALADEKELAAAFGGGSLPNIVLMSLTCSLGIVGQWLINVSRLGMPGNVVIVTSRLIGLVGSGILIAGFLSHYSTDVSRLERPSPPSKPDGGESGAATG
ncbi:MAG TPA: hypothetical protein VMR54_01175 [Thermoanaerobaculia bacterium]|nr:hypothetical protein [Thermoanaerobaculia bacterium]